MNIFTGAQLVAGFVPLDLQTARDGDWVKASDWVATNVVFFKGIGTAGDDPTLTLEQATDNAGAGAKALNFTTVWKKQAVDVLAVAQFTEVPQAAGNTFTDLAEQGAIVGIYVLRSSMDIAGGFKYIRLRVSDVGTNAQLGCVFYIPTAFIGQPPSAL